MLKVGQTGHKLNQDPDLSWFQRNCCHNPHTIMIMILIDDNDDNNDDGDDDADTDNVELTHS